MTRMRRHRGRLQDASRRAVPFCARPDLSLSRHEGKREGICHMGHLVRWHLLRSVVEVVSGGNSTFKCEVVALGISSGLWMSVLVPGARLQPQGVMGVVLGIHGCGRHIVNVPCPCTVDLDSYEYCLLVSSRTLKHLYCCSIVVYPPCSGI
ncbi:hypothetical protein CI102_10301 [Trichoderma harzianum]|jgi:hypothetical protein|nr:hypothetical protein CI102_10301 [Trichoderma harzianum]